tara:strand:+ start:1448 stop:1912 length:465 start_codon:yes stop_codon:yes gene_type:complete
MDKTYINWDTFHRDCNITAVKAASNGPKIDYMIALSRGGVVPARIMAEVIKPKNFLVLGLKLYDNYTSGDEVQITQDIPTYADMDRHDSILIVDDISDKGTTLSFAYSYIFKMSGGAHLYTACPYIKENTSRVPHFYHKTFSDDEWVVFPFEDD